MHWVHLDGGWIALGAGITVSRGHCVQGSLCPGVTVSRVQCGHLTITRSQGSVYMFVVQLGRVLANTLWDVMMFTALQKERALTAWLHSHVVS